MDNRAPMTFLEEYASLTGRVATFRLFLRSGQHGWPGDARRPDCDHVRILEPELKCRVRFITESCRSARVARRLIVRSAHFTAMPRFPGTRSGTSPTTRRLES